MKPRLGISIKDNSEKKNLTVTPCADAVRGTMNQNSWLAALL
jgi:hypothetical protein